MRHDFQDHPIVAAVSMPVIQLDGCFFSASDCVGTAHSARLAMTLKTRFRKSGLYDSHPRKRTSDSGFTARTVEPLAVEATRVPLVSTDPPSTQNPKTSFLLHVRAEGLLIPGH